VTGLRYSVILLSVTAAGVLIASLPVMSWSMVRASLRTSCPHTPKVVTH